MDKIFILNPSQIDTSKLHNAVHERITKAKAITNFILAYDDCIVKPTLYDLIWAVDSYLAELDCLNERTSYLFELG